VVASGEAGALEETNKTEVPLLEELRPGHFVACHVAASQVSQLSGSHREPHA
jgi:hypothetical protein